MFAKMESIVGRPTQKLAFAALLFLPVLDVANATSATSTFGVQLTVASACVINSAGAINFSNQGVLVANADTTSTVQVQCTNTTPYNIGLDAGSGSGASVNVRKLTSGSNTINYTLYCDSAHQIVWGNTVGTNTVAGTGNGDPQSYTVYARVPAQTTPAAGTYNDTITVTVTY